MKYLKQLQSKKLFTLQDVAAMTGNILTAKSLLQSYKKAGYIVSVRKNLYGALNLASGNIMASRYEIASQVSDSSYISHHSALEFHGTANQVFYEMTISADEKIRPFSFDGVSYLSHPSKGNEGVISATYNPLIKVTDIERTLADCIHDIDLAGGLEELLQCIRLIPQLNEDRIIRYLEMYDECYLWQKCGFILEQFRDQFGLSVDFYDECRRNIGKRKNYLRANVGLQYDSRWQLYAPADLMTITEEGGYEFV